ncbi:hypothetical protein NEPAR04_1922 [Nematocida parisii]|nr:hypothetical protein NEPAR08_1489 [Nematocida parisii]KAI5130159.1 hypothetical protein NEPAR03_1980 [Nematocida parisii]KAI5143726.1 hypothetical protein NEPAR04_1922 [Nematocida parisii]
MSNITESIISNNETVVTDTPIAELPTVSLHVTKVLAILIVAVIVIGIIIRILLSTMQKTRRARLCREMGIPLSGQSRYTRPDVDDITAHDRDNTLV